MYIYADLREMRHNNSVVLCYASCLDTTNKEIKISIAHKAHIATWFILGRPITHILTLILEPSASLLQYPQQVSIFKMHPAEFCDIVLFFHLVLICIGILGHSGGMPVPNQVLSAYEQVTGSLTPAQRYQLHYEVTRVIFAMRNVLNPIFPSIPLYLSESIPLSLPVYPMIAAQTTVVRPVPQAHLSASSNHNQASTSSGDVNADSDSEQEFEYNPNLKNSPPKKRFNRK